MKSAGCKSIQIGVESGSDWMLKKIRKGINTQDVLDTCKIIKKHKIQLHTFFIVGFPDETMESLNDTINFMFKIPVDTIIYSIFTPYYGTELFKDCQEKGIIPDDFDVSLYNHQSPENYFCPNIPKDIFNKKIRKLIPNDLTEITRAARTIYLNKTSFNGMYRVNQKGEFNIPMTSAKNPALYNRKNILACSEKLQGVKLSHGDYRECLKNAKKGDFVYLDPPYLPISKTSSFTNYTGYTFEDKEHKELLKDYQEIEILREKLVTFTSDRTFKNKMDLKFLREDQEW